MSKVVVTGSRSFIGTPLIAALKQRGVEVTGIDAASDIANEAVDIRDAAVADVVPEGADALIHLAAISRDPDCRADPAMAFDINVGGTLNLIKAARRRGVRQIIFASSEWVYGDVRNDEVQVEDQAIDVTALKSEYALTKIVGEQCLKLAHGQGLCPVTVLRFGIVYGARRGGSAVESIFNTLLAKDEVTVGSLKTARRFIFVDDIVSGIVAAIGRSSFEIFNLSGDHLISLGDVIAASAELLGKAPQIAESAPSAISIRNPDNARVKATLGWQPQISLAAGLRRIHDFLQAHPVA